MKQSQIASNSSRKLSDVNSHLRSKFFKKPPQEHFRLKIDSQSSIEEVSAPKTPALRHKGLLHLDGPAQILIKAHTTEISPRP